MWCLGVSLHLLSKSGSRLLGSVVAARVGSVVVAHGLSCSTACGIFPGQGLNLCSCVGGQILTHWTTKEVPDSTLKVAIC